MPTDHNGRMHCFSCGHFLSKYANGSTCWDCQDQHDKEASGCVKVCECGKMFRGWTYKPWTNNIRKSLPDDLWHKHWKELTEKGIAHDWVMVKHVDLTNAEILSGKVIVENHLKWEKR